MPEDEKLTQKVIDEYASVVDFLKTSRSFDKEIMFFVMNSFGEYDGAGMYEEVINLLKESPEDIIVPLIKLGLKSSSMGTRYWSTILSLSFPDRILLHELKENLCIDVTRDFALIAIEEINKRR